MEPADIFRDAVVNAFKAEGINTAPWQQFILPTMTVFQAKNACGSGCPWSCKVAKPVLHNIGDYPSVLKHLATNISISTQLRAPNDEEIAHMIGAGIRKVVENVSEISELPMQKVQGLACTKG